MIHRLYVHNFRCLENFELNLKEFPTALLIGKNGVGKSAVGAVLEVFQQIARGTNRIKDLLDLKDFSRGRSDVPIRLELEVSLENRLFKYSLALELPDGFRELRVLEEVLAVDGNPIFSRNFAQVFLYRNSMNSEARFMIDWHLIAFPIIQEQSEIDPLRLFKVWLARIIILSPIPKFMAGESFGESLQPIKDGKNFGEWMSGLLGQFPASYTNIFKYLHEIYPDLKDFMNASVGINSKNMIVRFAEGPTVFSVEFKDLSDGEKCLFVSAVVLAANESYGPLFCFWDEPDSHLSLNEVGHFVIALRRSFENSGQLLATSHNEETIRKFSDENTFLLDRKSHLEPTLIRRLCETQISGDKVNAQKRGDLGS